MNRRIFVRTTVASPLLGSLAPLRAQPAPPAEATAIVHPSDEFLASLPRLMEIAHLPGLGIAVVNEGRRPWLHYAGVASATTNAPINADSLFVAASLGKILFAYAVLRLVDDGKLDLDRPLKDYFPEAAPTGEWGGRVTARQVLSHSSGLDWRQPGRSFTPAFEPGTQFRYSGEGYYHLQRCVEKITGTGFEQFMQDRMMKPLSMTSSTYLWRADASGRLVAGHRGDSAPFVPGCYSTGFVVQLFERISRSGQPLAAWNHDLIGDAMARKKSAASPTPPADNEMYPNAAFSLLTTVPDYAAFLARMVIPPEAEDGLKPATRAEVMKPHSRVNSALSWGLGWCVEREAGRTYLWQWGSGYDGYYHFALVHPKTRSAIVVFTNGLNGLRVAERIVGAASGTDHPAFLWI
jgi:CubicO group peptidase (beta-lactamase class C family)